MTTPTHAFGEFSVVIFFSSGQYEYVRRYVSAEEAMRAALAYSSSPAARIGITQRVMITDGGDCCNWEWQARKGVVFPRLGRGGAIHMMGVYDP